MLVLTQHAFQMFSSSWIYNVQDKHVIRCIVQRRVHDDIIFAIMHSAK